MPLNGRRYHRTLLMLASLTAVSQPSVAFDRSDIHLKYTTTSWSERDGLPSSAVRAIAQDSDGYLWLATFSGLLRFDGTRFVNWSEHVEPSLPSEEVWSLRIA